jgi:methylated-DNA-[protein]-cysteine S-methyltransferase
MATIGATTRRHSRPSQVAWASVDAPIGPLLVAASPNGLVRVAFGSEHLDRFVVDLTTRLGALAIESPARLDTVRRQLDEYFAGTRRRFDVVLDWSFTTEFQHRVLEACTRIPYGTTASYSAVAVAADRPGAARAVGGALGVNPLAVVVPCHRVIRAGGDLGGFGGGPDTKAWLLAHEAAVGT